MTDIPQTGAMLVTPVTPQAASRLIGSISVTGIKAVMSLLAQILLSGLFVVGYFGMLYLFMTGNVRVPVELRDIFNNLIGVLTAMILLVMNFWFASSRSSQAKDGQ